MPMAQHGGVFSRDEAVAFPLRELIVQPAVMGGVHDGWMEAVFVIMRQSKFTIRSSSDGMAFEHLHEPLDG
jgi:hypothetical protein